MRKNRQQTMYRRKRVKQVKDVRVDTTPTGFTKWLCDVFKVKYDV